MSPIRTSSLQASIALIFAIGAMAGCGGGGGGGDGTTAAASGKAQSIFAAPSGPLCASKNGDVCIEPTSSSTTPSELYAALSNSIGPQIEFTRFGTTMDIHIVSTGGQVADGDEPTSIYTRGEYTYGGRDKTFALGRNSVLLDQKTYTYFTTTIDNFMLFNASGPGEMIMIPKDFDGTSALSQIESSITWNSATTTTDFKSWGSAFGLLTDHTDVSEPADHLIRYQGQIVVMAGNGAPTADGKHLRATGATCPICLTLDTSSGRIITGTPDCTDETGSTLAFSLKDLTVKNSRIVATGTEATASVTGPTFETDGRTPAVTSAAFDSDKIGGGVYDKNAQFLMIFGAGALGNFSIATARQ